MRNNEIMNKQYSQIVAWNEDVQKVHEEHKKKFNETKEYISKVC